MNKTIENNDILTTQELSGYLKLNEKTVLKLAQTGKIPGFKIGNQWRFYLSAIDEYLQDNIVKTPTYNIGEMISSTDIMPLSRFTDEPHIDLNLKSKNKKGVLRELASIAAESGIVNSVDRIFNKLLERENMLSTAVGKGIAIPHPRNPSDELFSHPLVIIGRSVNGIDFKAPDNVKVNIFFMPCATDVVMHLKLLEKISKFLTLKNIFQQLMKVDSASDVIKLLLENERVNLK